MRLNTIIIAAALTAFAGSAMATTAPDTGVKAKLHAKSLMQLASCQHQRGKASGGGATGGGSSTGT